jgi:hypothetical protein
LVRRGVRSKIYSCRPLGHYVKRLTHTKRVQAQNCHGVHVTSLYLALSPCQGGLSNICTNCSKLLICLRLMSTLLFQKKKKMSTPFPVYCHIVQIFGIRESFPLQLEPLSIFPLLITVLGNQASCSRTKQEVAIQSNSNEPKEESFM